MVYPQNAGLYQGLQDMRALNQRIAARGTPPYRTSTPSLGLAATPQPQSQPSPAMIFDSPAHRAVYEKYGGRQLDQMNESELLGELGRMKQKATAMIGSPMQPYQPGPQGPSGLQSYGGAYGNPGAVPLPFERGARPPAIPLGMAPTNQADFAQRMRTENPAHAFGGTLPVMGAGGTPVFATAPAQPSLGLANPAAFAQQHGYAYNPQTGQMGSTSVLSMNPHEAAIAGITGRGPGQYLTPAQANAGRAAALGLAQGRQDARKQATLARVDKRAANRQNAFNNQMELGLARANPAAYSQFKQAQGQLGLANANMQSTNAFRDRQLAQQKELTLAGHANQQKIASLGLAKAGVDANGQPIQTAAEKIASAPPADDLRGKSPEEQQAMVEHLPPATQKRLLQEARTPQRSMFGSVVDSPFGEFLGNYGGGKNLNALAGLLGFGPKAPVGLSPKAKQVIEENKKKGNPR